MRKRTYVVLVAVAGALLLSFAVGTASANRVRSSSASLRFVWTPMTFTAAEVFVYCDVILEGTLHSATVPKTVGSLIGLLTRATINFCTQGTVSVLSETLPWHLVYMGYTGFLPAFSNLQVAIVGMSGLASVAGVSCLYRSTSERPLRAMLHVEAARAVTSISAEGLASPIPKASGSLLCPSTMTAFGLGSVSRAGSEEAVRLTLI